MSRNLQHVVGHSQPGQASPGFPVGYDYEAPGSHAIVVATARW